MKNEHGNECGGKVSAFHTADYTPAEWHEPNDPRGLTHALIQGRAPDGQQSGTDC